MSFNHNQSVRNSPVAVALAPSLLLTAGIPGQGRARATERRTPGSRSSSTIAWALAIVAILALARSGYAADVTWALADGAGGEWEKAASWNGLPQGQTEPGAADHVTIGPNKGKITITSDAAPKKLKSLKMEPSTNNAKRTHIETNFDAATGRGRNLMIEVAGTIPGEAGIGIRIGKLNKVVASTSSVVGDVAPSPGGNVSLKSEAGQIITEDGTLIAAGAGAASAAHGAKPGGNLTIEAEKEVRLSGEVFAGTGSDSLAAAHDGGAGGSTAIQSNGDVITTSKAAVIRGGDGGSGFFVAGVAKSNGGNGGGHRELATRLVAKSGVTNKGTIRGGHAGKGFVLTNENFPAGNGGEVAIQCLAAGGTVQNDGTIGGGNGRHTGGTVFISKNIAKVHNTRSITGGDADGAGTLGWGGNVTINAKTEIHNDTDATLEGGRGAMATANPDRLAGSGGSITLGKHPGDPSDDECDDIMNDGAIRGGKAGLTVPVLGPLPMGNTPGGKIFITAKDLVTLKKNSLIAGGTGSDPATMKPRGNVTIKVTGQQGKIVGPKTVDATAKLNGKKVHILKSVDIVRKSAATGRPAESSASPTADIDFSLSPAGFVEADELVCLDAGPGGIIDLSRAAENAIVAHEEGSLGEIHIAADLVLPELSGAIDAMTQPDAVLETTLCECCDIGCPADLDADGDVDGIDLAQLLGAWGQCRMTVDEPCLADFDDNGFIDANDLASMLAAWGPCL